MGLDERAFQERSNLRPLVAGSAMTHIAIQESQNGSPVTWLEHVTDEQYLAGASAAEDER